VVYGRRLDDRTLNFEASGALKSAALIMRDRETDSWWSIMSSNSIGGELEGADLEELPVGEKTTWKRWRQKHPDTLVLSVEGEEHVENNPYDNYFASDGTFRDLEIDDKRLQPKAPVYSFWLDGEPWAVDHEAFGGGTVFEVEELDGRDLLLYRTKKGPIYESSRAWLVDPRLTAEHGPTKLLAMADSGDSGFEPVPGFDTFWYTWVATNPQTHLID
jgi:hypothetical protein